MLETATAATYEFVAPIKRKKGEKCPPWLPQRQGRLAPPSHEARRNRLGAADVAAPQLPESAAASGGTRFSPFTSCPFVAGGVAWASLHVVRL